MLTSAIVLLVTLLAGATADGAPRPARVGILGFSEEARFFELRAGLAQGLADQGYSAQAVELLEARVGRGNRAEARAAVEALVRQQVAALFITGTELTRIAREAASELPIVFITPGDPIAAGVVSSLARPGGHTTGMTFEYPELSGKRLEILKELSPPARRILVLFDPRDASPRQGVAAAREAAARLGLVLVERQARSRDEIQQGLKALAEADAVLGIPGGMPSGHYEDIIRRAHARRLPTIFHVTRSTAEAVATYGVSDAAVAREAARLVARILKGARAGELPVERPTRIELVVNLKSAGALGLTIPRPLLLRADRVIE